MTMAKQYDDEQLRAIEANGGHFLVLAPPGCGKTDILSERIVRARQQGVDFSEMLCLTFTNRASRGMRDRVKERVGEDVCHIFVGNVHRYCSRFLYDNEIIPANSSIIDDEDVEEIVRSLDSQLSKKTEFQLIDNIDAYILQRKLRHPRSAIFLPDDYEKYYKAAKTADFDPHLVEGYNKELATALAYRKYKDEHNLLSFNDILIRAYDTLRGDTERKYKRYSWVQVDEVQDLNALQTAIIDELLDTSHTFTAMYLGDEQQAIFSFLGAKLGQLQLLKNRCSGNIMSLGTNYRSPKYLLDVFNTYAEKELGVDPGLLPKSLNLAKQDRFDLILTGNATPEDENNRIARMVDYYLKFDDERIAILVPTNAAADTISNRLKAGGITHFKISGADMFRSMSYKTLAAFLCISVNDFNAMAWARLLRGIGAFKTKTGAMAFIRELRELMMTPSDLFSNESYVARFNNAYDSEEFVFFDTETTGLNVLEDDIVQIAAFKVKGREKVQGSDFCIFLETDKEIPATLSNGLENPMIAAYAAHPHYSRAEGLQLFLDYIGNRPLLGHNVGYDYRILQKNVERALHEIVTYDIYDSLRLIKCVHPRLRSYKLVNLIDTLQLEGKNSHLADEDIAATKALVDYCYRQSQSVAPRQQAALNTPETARVISRMQPLIPLFENLQARLYDPISSTYRTIADEQKDLYDTMLSEGLIEDEGFGEKFDIYLKFIQSEWVDNEREETLFDQINAHVNDMTASINEGDLVNSEDLIRDRVFIMTVYKGKGLEFDNVVILNANDGVYPFWTVNRVLKSAHKYSAEEIAKARTDRKEDARKFYVALSRAKKRVCVSYTEENSRGCPAERTPFMDCIKDYFTQG